MNQLKLGQTKSGQNKPKTSGQTDKKKSIINFNLGQKSEQKLGEKKIQQGQKTEKKSTGKFNLGGQFDKADEFEESRTQKPNQDELKQKIPDIKNRLNFKQ